MADFLHACAGFCAGCQTVHTVPIGSADIAARALIQKLDREKRVDLHLPPEKADSRFSIDYLFGEARGKMFGVMICQRGDGSVMTVKAFSGQYNGEWEIEGWAPPLFDLQTWHRVNDDTEKEIKKIGMQIDALEETSSHQTKLASKRKRLSRELMEEIHQLYALHNFRSECRPLSVVYTGKNGIPNGTADCCGPKLLNFAARNNLLPLGLAEFYYGRKNKQGSRIHGMFYPSCKDKCAPILGFMLCGLNINREPITKSRWNPKPSRSFNENGRRST